MHAPLRLWLRFIGVEFWLVALVPFQIGFIVGAQAWSSRAGLLGLATVALLTASSFVLNHLCDLETDRRNPRKAFSLLVRGDLTLAAGWALFGALQVATLALAALAGRDFLLCLLGLTAISLAYNIAPLRLKERPGLDIAANGASLGFLLPLAGWSLSQYVKKDARPASFQRQKRARQSQKAPEPDECFGAADSALASHYSQLTAGLFYVPPTARSTRAVPDQDA